MKPLIVILYNIRSTYNVGAILRTCECLGVDGAIFSGYTPFLDKGLPHEQAKLRKQIHKTALGAEELVAWERRDDILTAISDLRAKGYKIYALEQGIERPALNILDVKNYPNQVALILGEEVHGIPKEILAACDELIEIPMRGQKESFNVSVAAGIAIWEISKASQNGKEMYLRTQKESRQPE